MERHKHEILQIKQVQKDVETPLFFCHNNPVEKDKNAKISTG